MMKLGIPSDFQGSIALVKPIIVKVTCPIVDWLTEDRLAFTNTINRIRFHIDCKKKKEKKDIHEKVCLY